MANENRFKLLREERSTKTKNYTQQMLSDDFQKNQNRGIKQGRISTIEKMDHKNKERPTFEDLLAYQKEFNVSLDYLMYLSDSRTISNNNKGILDKTGLLEQSIKTLKSLSKKQRYPRKENVIIPNLASRETQGINILLNSPSYAKIFDLIYQYLVVDILHDESNSPLDTNSLDTTSRNDLYKAQMLHLITQELAYIRKDIAENKPKHWGIIKPYTKEQYDRLIDRSLEHISSHNKGIDTDIERTLENIERHKTNDDIIANPKNEIKSLINRHGGYEKGEKLERDSNNLKFEKEYYYNTSYNDTEYKHKILQQCIEQTQKGSDD